MKDLDLLTHLYAGIMAMKTYGLSQEDIPNLIPKARVIARKALEEIYKLEREETIAWAKAASETRSKDIDYSKFNLLYHVTPMGNWEWNLKQLAQRIHIFGGKQVISLAVNEGETRLIPIQKKIREWIPECTIEPFVNDSTIRETKSFQYLLEEASTFPKDSYTFYAHTKGVTRGDNEAVKLWTAGLYHYNLDYLDQVMEVLKTHPVAGSFRRLGRFTGFPVKSMWHYSGTFFWFRNKDLFAKPNWKDVPKSRYGTEAYLSLLFKQKEAGLLWWNKVGDLYDLKYLKALLGEELAKVEAHAEI